MSRNPKKWANLVFFNNNFSSKIPPNCSINPFVWSDFRECTKNKNPEEVKCCVEDGLELGIRRDNFVSFSQVFYLMPEDMDRRRHAPKDEEANVIKLYTSSVLIFLQSKKSKISQTAMIKGYFSSPLPFCYYIARHNQAAADDMQCCF